MYVIGRCAIAERRTPCYRDYSTVVGVSLAYRSPVQILTAMCELSEILYALVNTSN